MNTRPRRCAKRCGQGIKRMEFADSELRQFDLTAENAKSAKGKRQYPRRASGTARQHLVIPIAACAERLQDFADAGRLDIAQAGSLSVLLLAPRVADELLKLGQLIRGQERDSHFDLCERAHWGNGSTVAPSGASDVRNGTSGFLLLVQPSERVGGHWGKVEADGSH